VIIAAGGINESGLVCNFFTVSGAVKRSFLTVSASFFVLVVSATLFWALAPIEIIHNKENNIFFNGGVLNVFKQSQKLNHSARELFDYLTIN